MPNVFASHNVGRVIGGWSIASSTQPDLGELQIRRHRREAEEKLGAKFDQRRFHDTILAIGSVPLSVVEEHIARFIPPSCRTRPNRNDRNLRDIALVSSWAGLVLTADTKTL